MDKKLIEYICIDFGTICIDIVQKHHASSGIDCMSIRWLSKAVGATVYFLVTIKVGASTIIIIIKGGRLSEKSVNNLNIIYLGNPTEPALLTISIILF